MPHSIPLDSRSVLSVSRAPRSELVAPVDPLYADNCFLKKRLHCRYGSQRCQILILTLTNMSSVALELRRFRKQILYTVGVEGKIHSLIHLSLNDSRLSLKNSQLVSVIKLVIICGYWKALYWWGRTDIFYIWHVFQSLQNLYIDLPKICMHALLLKIWNVSRIVSVSKSNPAVRGLKMIKLLSCFAFILLFSV